MRTFVLSFAALLALSSPALAHVEGDWAGSLHYTANDGTDEQWDCTVDITYSANGKYLYYDDTEGCNYTPDYVTRFDVRGNELYYGDQLYGTISEHGIHFEIQDDTVHWVLDVAHTEDGSLTVRETIDDTEEQFSDVLEGTLTASTQPHARPATPHRRAKLQRR